MADAATNRGKYSLGQILVGGSVSGTLKMGLLTTFAGTTNVPDVNFISDMEAHADFAEATSGAISGYARVALSTKTVTEDDTNDWALFDADDVSFGALGTGGTIVGYFIAWDTGSDATSAVLQMGSLTSTPTNGGTFVATTPSGILKLV